MKYFKKSNLTIAKQYNKLVSNYSNIIIDKKCYSDYFYISLNLKPLINSFLYEVVICQKVDKRPKVYVKEPNLYDLTNGVKPPHVYSFDKEMTKICLNLPDEIDLGKFYDYIVPWASEWLFNFEIWLVTGKWCGGGHKTEPEDEE